MIQIKKMIVFLFGLLPLTAVADEVNVVYMTTTTTKGQTVETRLLEKKGETLPRFYTADNTIRINSVVYLKDEIASIRFSIRTETVDAINEVEGDDEYAKKHAVYTLDGKLVRTDAASLEELPKGIYIINKKKVVVK